QQADGGRAHQRRLRGRVVRAAGQVQRGQDEARRVARRAEAQVEGQGVRLAGGRLVAAGGGQAGQVFEAASKGQRHYQLVGALPLGAGQHQVGINLGQQRPQPGQVGGGQGD